MNINTFEISKFNLKKKKGIFFFLHNFPYILLLIHKFYWENKLLYQDFEILLSFSVRLKVIITMLLCSLSIKIIYFLYLYQNLSSVTLLKNVKVEKLFYFPK